MLHAWARRSIFVFAAFARPCSAVDVTGAGSTFVYTLVARWATTYARETGHRINYQSIGSGGGLKQIVNRTVDFGATDRPLDRAELEKLELVQFPVVAGAIVPVVHLNGIGDAELKLTGPVLADVFLGKIRRWNDPEIRALNPQVSLPDRIITVVHRADGSGTSFVWTTYLSTVSENWRTRVGAAVAVDWPSGVGGKGNEGVAAFVKLTEGAIGYVESAFVARAHLSGVRLLNRDGNFVRADLDSFRAALARIDWSREGEASLLNAPGARSWPVAGATYALLRRRPENALGQRTVLAFFRWALDHGGAAAEELHYVPLPAALRRRVISAWPARFEF